MSDEPDVSVVPVEGDREATVSFEGSFQSYRGPLPSPEMLGDYEKVVPGGAERIISMVETQQSHRMAMESKEMEATLEIAKGVQRAEMHGQYISLGIVAASATAAIVVAIIDPSWVVAVGSPAVAWVAAWALRGMWRQADMRDPADGANSDE